ncbi:alpha/beta hydrolase [Polycladomyces subterraneus]|uniref:Lysophospholipase n=1 Tax=Polycladomyces subterraneus TaxID=1016997 RepID=A0ABT8INJ8_9BACL|nr:alpha/beta hydrolase [Polycladomyces subterraneus]MDN4594310.1 lysophospholipase [Polycladomyces subterraneus]
MFVGVSVENYEDRLYTWDGVYIHYRTWLPHEPRAVAVLVHGAGEHLGLYEHLGERFIRDGFGLVLYDLRGFGYSEGRCGHVTHFHEYLNDLDQLVHVFRKKLGNRCIYLIGHSLGGLIVTRYAQLRPDHVDGIVLSAPALALRIHVPISVRRLISIISRVAPSFSINPYGLMKKAQRIPRLKSMVTYHVQTNKMVDPLIPLKYSVRWIQQLLVQTEEALQNVTSITVPTLCICGNNDTLIPSDIVRLFFDSLTVKEKEWLLLPEFGHCILHSEQSSSVIDTLIGWLKRQVQVAFRE